MSLLGEGTSVGAQVEMELELDVGVECRDDGLLVAVGGRGGLIRTGERVVVREINLPH